MTTIVTVNAHAGWPVRVEAVDTYDGKTTCTELGIVAPGVVQDFYAHSNRQLIITELQRPS